MEDTIIKENIVLEKDNILMKNTIRIAIWNSQSLTEWTKRCFLLQLLNLNKIYICCINETWLLDTHSLYFKGFKIYRANAGIKRRGCAILISNRLNP